VSGETFSFGAHQTPFEQRQKKTYLIYKQPDVSPADGITMSETKIVEATLMQLQSLKGVGWKIIMEVTAQ
jgi:hypothetical protein